MVSGVRKVAPSVEPLDSFSALSDRIFRPAGTKPHPCTLPCIHCQTVEFLSRNCPALQTCRTNVQCIAYRNSCVAHCYTPLNWYAVKFVHSCFSVLGNDIPGNSLSSSLIQRSPAFLCSIHPSVFVVQMLLNTCMCIASCTLKYIEKYGEYDIGNITYKLHIMRIK